MVSAVNHAGIWCQIFSLNTILRNPAACLMAVQDQLVEPWRSQILSQTFKDPIIATHPVIAPVVFRVGRLQTLVIRTVFKCFSCSS